MRLLKWLSVIFLSNAFLCPAASAQARPVMSGFPLYPGAEEIVRRGPSEEDRIFRDLKNGQLVILSGSEELRIDLSSRANANIRADITSLGESRWKYQYTVTNDPGSLEPVKLWFLENPRPGIPDPRIKDDIALAPGLLPAWEAEHFSMGHGRWAMRWAWIGGGPAVEAGAEESGFLLESGRRPGFVMAYFQSSLPGIIPEQLSPQTRERLRVLHDLGYNSRSRLTLGPKFGAEAAARDIAADFHVGISRLVISRQLNERSLFVRGFQEYLQERIDDPRPYEAGEIPRYEGIPPTTPLEQSIYQAFEAAN